MGSEMALLLHGADGFRGALSLRLRAHPSLPGGHAQVRLTRGDQVLADLEIGPAPMRFEIPLGGEGLRSLGLQAVPIEISCRATVTGPHQDPRCAEMGRVLFEPQEAMRVDVLAWRVLSQAWLLLCVALLFHLPAVCAFLGGRDLSAPVLLVLAGGLAAWARADPYTLAWVLPPAPNALLTLSVLVAAAHFRRPRALEGRPESRLASLPPTWRTIALPLAAIAIVGLLLRTYRLTELPFGMWRDEARHGLLAARLGPNPLDWPIYEPRINSPGFGLWLLGLGVEVFGIHAWSMRPVTALAGTLTAIPLFLFARRLTGRADVAMLACGLRRLLELARPGEPIPVSDGVRPPAAALGPLAGPGSRRHRQASAFSVLSRSRGRFRRARGADLSHGAPRSSGHRTRGRARPLEAAAPGASGGRLWAGPPSHPGPPGSLGDLARPGLQQPGIPAVRGPGGRGRRHRAPRALSTPRGEDIC